MKKLPALFAHLVWPVHCPVCGRIGVAFCQECLESSVEPLPAFCLECGRVYGFGCCRSSVPCYAAAAHDGRARKFLLDLKYHNTRGLGLQMGRLAGLAFSGGIAADVVVPVPLHKSAAREYNQSDILARGIARELELPVEPHALWWSLEVRRQTSRRGRERTALPDGALSASKSLAGRKILLVDDVYTTGGTLRAARRAVEKAGGGVSGAVVWTRKVSSA